jgi:hypothetical protein
VIDESNQVDEPEPAAEPQQEVLEEGALRSTGRSHRDTRHDATGRREMRRNKRRRYSLHEHEKRAERPPELLRPLFQQFGRTSGLLGRLAALLMAKGADDDRWLVDLLDMQPDDCVLEVGFGPGAAIELIAARATRGLVGSVDPSGAHGTAGDQAQIGRRCRQAVSNFDKEQFRRCRSQTRHSPRCWRCIRSIFGRRLRRECVSCIACYLRAVAWRSVSGCINRT